MSHEDDLNRIYVPKTLRVFISYSDKDKNVAASIKNHLSRFGIQAFLAHEDIPPGENWNDLIIKSIKSADIFFALLSNNFKESKWTDQEVGIAISLDKFVIPVCIDAVLPYGFMEKFQAFRNFSCESHSFEGKVHIDCSLETDKIINFIAKKSQFKDNIKDSIISSLPSVVGFRRAEKHLEILIELQPFSHVQINAILMYCCLNDQIYGAYGCKPILRNLAENYSLLIPELKKVEILRLIE